MLLIDQKTPSQLTDVHLIRMRYPGQLHASDLKASSKFTGLLLTEGALPAYLLELSALLDASD